MKISMLFFLLIFCGVVAAQEVVKLKFSSSFMPGEPHNMWANHTLDLMEKRTGGRIRVP